MWFMLTFIPLIAAPSAPANPLAIIYILIASIVFSLPALATKWQEVRAGAHYDNKSLYQTSFLRFIFSAISVIAIVSVGINLSLQGVTLNRLTSDFLSVTSDLIVDRYTENTIDSVFAQLANIFTYSSAALGGLVFFGAKKRWAKLLILAVTMTPSLALMAIAGAKGTIFLCISLFYGAILAARVREGATQILDRKTLAGIFGSLLVLVPFVTLSFLARGLYGPGTSDVSSGLYRNFISYSSAHIYAFSDWFSWYIGQDSAITYAREDLTGGFYTFMSVFKALGSLKEVPPGYYDEYFQYSWYLQTNIYTAFRGLILDFSLTGSIVFMYAAGFASNWFFTALMRSKVPAWSMSLFILFCGLAYTSFLISVFVWNSMYPVYAIISLILIINHEKVKQKRR